MTTENAWQGERWWTSPYNFTEETRDRMRLPKRVTFHDATLRDGEQTPGVVFTPADKVEIAKALDAVGVDRIEAGMPAVSKDDFNAVKEIAGLGLDAEITVFSRAMAKDIDDAVACGVDGVILEVPSGEPRLKYQFNWSEEEVIDKSLNAVKYAKDCGLKVVFFPYDTSRSKFSFLRDLVGKVVSEGKPDSVAVIDTTGCCLPTGMFQLVTKVREIVGGLPVEVHTHNDFGLAVANTLAALEAGAEVLHGCLTGLGERTGNAPLEEIAVAVSLLYGVDHNLKHEMFYQTAHLIREKAKIPIPPSKPLLGAHCFAREIGIGIDMLHKAPQAVFAVEPEYVGTKSIALLGKKSGKGSISMKMKELGLQKELDEDAQKKLLEEIKGLSIKRKGLVTNEEFEKMVNALP